MTAFPPVPLVHGVAAPLIRANVDTDAIIPSREIRGVGKTGLADGLFAGWRYLPGTHDPDPAFVLNDPAYAGAPILLGGENFGCGSSREHAVWALHEYGFRAVIAPSFAPIFQGNCVRNGVVPVVLAADGIARLGREVTVDLETMTVTSDHASFPFALDPEARTMLMEGLDAIDLTMKNAAAITAFHTTDRTARPWVYLNPPHSKNGEGDRPKDGGGVAHLPPRTNAAVLRARRLRRSMSPPEVALWSILRKRPADLKFRRQHPAAQYTLDFYCPAARLCVEVDGEGHGHGHRPERDAARDQFLNEHNVATLRVTAAEVWRNMEGVITQIVEVARARLPLHRPVGGPPPQSAIGEDL